MNWIRLQNNKLKQYTDYTLTYRLTGQYRYRHEARQHEVFHKHRLQTNQHRTANTRALNRGTNDEALGVKLEQNLVHLE